MKLRALILVVISLGAAEPPPPMPPSPVAEFRAWLTMEPARRQVALATRPERSRRVLQQKIEEYKALPEPERERRLTALELRWLMDLPKEKRAEALQQVSPLWLPMVQQRLNQWDGMTPELRKEVLDHEFTLQYFSSPPQQQERSLAALPEADRERLQARIAKWSGMSSEEQQRLGDVLNMSLEQQRRTLNYFSDAERAAMQQTLVAFRSLTPAQRQVCLSSFGKFASMSREEQLAFLKNAERWQAMSQEERKSWRRVVQVVPPMPEMPQAMPQLPVLPGK